MFLDNYFIQPQQNSTVRGTLDNDIFDNVTTACFIREPRRMEAKLREYRALRRRKEMIDNAKEKLENTRRKVVSFLLPNVFSDMDRDNKEEEVLLLEDEELPPTSSNHVQDIHPIKPEEAYDVGSEVSELESMEEEKQESWQYFLIKWTLYSIIWLSCYMYFLSVGFGAVFFVVSMLIGICLNTSTRKKKKGEVSAYSVFNENCTSIEGTLKAEQLQREMMFGMGGVRMF